MNLAHRKQVNVFIWIFLFTILGPILGALQLVVYLSFYGGLSTFGVLPIALLYSMVFLLPALATGIITFILRKKIYKLWHLLLISLSGALMVYLWMFFISIEQSIYSRHFDLLVLIIASITTLLLLSVFYQRKHSSK